MSPSIKTKIPSSVTVRGDIAYIELMNSDLFAIVDASEASNVSGLRWRLRNTHGHKYAICHKEQKGVLLHRHILQLTDPVVHVDHIDGDGLNNRRSNIRACSSSENSWNKRTKAMKEVAYKGVRKANGLFRAAICAKNIQYDLGTYKTAEEASAAYCGAAIVLHGSYANFVDSVIVDDPRAKPEI